MKQWFRLGWWHHAVPLSPKDWAVMKCTLRKERSNIQPRYRSRVLMHLKMTNHSKTSSATYTWNAPSISQSTDILQGPWPPGQAKTPRTLAGPPEGQGREQRQSSSRSPLYSRGPWWAFCPALQKPPKANCDQTIKFPSLRLPCPTLSRSFHFKYANTVNWHRHAPIWVTV